MSTGSASSPAVDVDVQGVSVDAHFEHQRFTRQKRSGRGDGARAFVAECQAVAGDLALELGRTPECDDLAGSTIATRLHNASASSR